MKNNAMKSTAIKCSLMAVFLFLVGAVVEYKFSMIVDLKRFAFPEEKLSRLPIEADPHLERVYNGRSTDHSRSDNIMPSADWRNELRRKILKEIDIFMAPEGVIKYEILQEKTTANGIRQLLISFKSFDGSSIPAYLHLPNREGPMPAVLVMSGHVRAGQSGIEQLAKQETSYQHAAALQLAQQGFVTLSFELRGFGYLGSPHHTEHRLVAYNAILMGQSYKEVIMRDMNFAVSLLRGMDQVDPERIGLTGASLGGELTVNYAALDTSIKAVLFQAYGGRKGFKGIVKGGRDDQPHYCHLMPGLDLLVKREEWIWLLAPRPTLAVRGNEDSGVGKETIELYKSGWAERDGFQFMVGEGGHEYFVQPAIQFFKLHL